MFQMPVTRRTPKAGHAIRLYARAAARGTSVPMPFNAGTRAARVTCPPTQIVAGSTCRDNRMVSTVEASMPTGCQSQQLLRRIEVDDELALCVPTLEPYRFARRVRQLEVPRHYSPLRMAG